MTKEQLSYINGLDSKKEIKNQLNEWFGVKELEVGKWLEFGKWYKKEIAIGKTILFCFAGNYTNLNNSGAYGFCASGNWSENIGVDKYDNIPATEQEVEEALKKEAIKRGFKKDIHCKDVNDNIFKSNIDLDFWNLKSKRGDLQNLFNISISENAGVIFRDGKWGEVIQKITKEEAEKQLGKIIV